MNTNFVVLSLVLALSIQTALAAEGTETSCSDEYAQRAHALSLGVFPAQVGVIGATAGYLAGASATGVILSSAAIMYPVVAVAGVTLGGMLGRASRLNKIAMLIARAEGKGLTDKENAEVDALLVKLTRKVRRISGRDLTRADVSALVEQAVAAGTLCDGRVLGLTGLARKLSN